jgi:hypothetical protein
MEQMPTEAASEECRTSVNEARTIRYKLEYVQKKNAQEGVEYLHHKCTCEHGAKKESAT